jgi:hypothetical protein
MRGNSPAPRGIGIYTSSFADLWYETPFFHKKRRHPRLARGSSIACPRDKDSYASRTLGAGSPRKAGMTALLRGLPTAQLRKAKLV